MTFVFLSGGAREKALELLLENKINILVVIVPVLTTSNSRFLEVVEVALKYGIPVIPVNKGNLETALAKYQFDVLISCGFPFIINSAVISMAKKISINVHPTLLPTYRGFRSGPFILINGEKKSGVTVHKLTEDMDKGPIIEQESFDISVFDTTTSVFRKAKNFEPAILLKAVLNIINGTFLLTNQDESRATTYNQIRTPDDSIIDWNKPLKDLYNEIRACDSENYPAYFMVNNERVCIKLWRKNRGNDYNDMI